MTPEESTIWKGNASQLTHFRFYLIWLLIAALIVAAGTMFMRPRLFSALLIPGIVIWVRWQLTKATAYQLTTQHLRKTTGLFSRKLGEMELYRVKETTLDQPILLRLFGVGHIKVLSSDAAHPEMTLVAVNHAYEVREKLRSAVEVEQTRNLVHDVGSTQSSSGKIVETPAVLEAGGCDVSTIGNPGH